MLYVLWGGLPWRMLLPGLFPPMTVVQHYFYAWRDRGLWSSINDTLLMTAREAVGREASPSAKAPGASSSTIQTASGPSEPPMGMCQSLGGLV